MITVIVSRYKEDISWLYNIADNILLEKFLIFNKGDNDIESKHSKIEIIDVPNKGREGGTYLDYIINNYDNFPENLIFCQADPFDHNEGFLNLFNYENLDYVIENKDFLSITRYYRKDWPFIDGEQYNSIVINNFICNNYLIDKYSLNIIGPCAAIDETQAFNDRLINYKYKTDSFMDFLCNCLEIAIPKKIINFNMAACFFVKSKQILRHPVKVYIKLNKFLYNTDSQGGGEVYILERFWDYLFTGRSYYTIHDGLKEPMQNIFPIISIYCNVEKKLYIKNVKNCTTTYEDRNKFLIYKNNDIIKILPCIDYSGSDTSILPCYSLKDARHIYKEFVKNYSLLDTSPAFYFYIRGHIRNSFKTNRLKNFINLVKFNFPNVIFIFQTWNKIHCDPRLTWRFNQKEINIVKNDTILKERHLKKYFDEIEFSYLILNENEISLTGNVEGKLLTTPKRGWKNMWYGINNGLEKLATKNIPIFVFRYDYFELDDVFKNGNEKEIIEFIKSNIIEKTIKFTKNEGPGSDNIFCGPLNKIKILTKNFNYNLDSIISYNFKARRHENLVNEVAKLIN